MTTERIVHQDAEYESLAKDALAWIIFAKQPLSASQLQHALAIEIGETVLDEENLPYIGAIISACVGLVTVDEQSNVIRLIHYTLEEYLQGTWMEWLPNAHASITKACVTYLAFDAFECGPCESSKGFWDRLERYDLYNYASRTGATMPVMSKGIQRKPQTYACAFSSRRTRPLAQVRL